MFEAAKINSDAFAGGHGDAELYRHAWFENQMFLYGSDDSSPITVRVTGVVSRPELNGKTVRITRRMVKADRYTVHEQDANGQLKVGSKPFNLEAEKLPSPSRRVSRRGKSQDCPGAERKGWCGRGI